MFRFLADENFNGDAFEGLRLHLTEIDLVRVQDVGLSGKNDVIVLEWAASQGRILLSHDQSTIPDLAYDRVSTNRRMPGVILFNVLLPVGRVLEEMAMVVRCSPPEEWTDRVVHLPW